MFPRDRYAPPSGHRKPDLPSPRLVVPRPRARRGAALSLAIHGGIIVALLWGGREVFGGAGDGPGPRGGGGGGGRAALHLFLLSGAGAPQAVPVPPVPQVSVARMPLPDPVKLELPRVETPVPPPPSSQAAVPGTGAGTTGGPGAGPGSGGGKGAGTGTGVGNDSGPGTGGNGSYAPQPFLVTWPLPPTCLPRGQYSLHFWVTESGAIDKVEIEPKVKDGDCARDLDKRAHDFKFLPAKTRSGIPVASTYTAQLTR